MLAFIGGTGPEGLGLAMRFALAGEELVIGSRVEERALAAADKIKARLGGRANSRVLGMVNQEAVQAGDIVLITVPYSGQRDILTSLEEFIGEKIVIDTVVPIEFEKGRAKAIPVKEGSAAQEAQQILSKARVVGAFQNLSAEKLQDIEEEVSADVIVCSDHKEDRRLVMDLGEKIQGIRAVNGGGLSNCRYVEDFTAMLLNLNRIYKAQSSIKIVGI